MGSGMTSPSCTFVRPRRPRAYRLKFILRIAIGEPLSYPGKREGEIPLFLKPSVIPGPKRVPDEKGLTRGAHGCGPKLAGK